MDRGLDRPGLDPAAFDRAAFDRDHPGWPPRGPTAPLFCLPEEVVALLEAPCAKLPAAIDATAAAAERALLALCRRYHAVGFHGPTPIAYPFLSAPVPLMTREGSPPDLNWSAANWADLARAGPKLAVANRRVTGYAGWLLTEPDFLRQAARLETAWLALPDGLRPRFPLYRPQHLDEPPDDATPAPAPLAGFTAEYVAFCDHWALTHMAAWGLPYPQGPHSPSSVPLPPTLVPRNAVHLVLPHYYPLTGDDDLHRAVLKAQRRLALDLGLPVGSAGLAHHEAYAQVLGVVHLERTILGRFGRRRMPRGGVGLLEAAIAEALNLSTPQVRRYRKAARACVLRGDRSGVERPRRPRD